MKKILYIATIGFTLLTSSCNDFLDRQVPQGIVTGDQIASPEYVDNLVISAYAIWATGDDINSSFSLWNYDVRSDDCYKGGSGTEDGGVFNALEISKGINTTDWNINDIWKRLYQCITRANTALQSLDLMDEKTYPLKNQRIAEMRFLRGHAHFMLKELFKKIVIVNDENMDPDAYNELSNTTYTNNEQWQKIADDFQFAYDNLPEVQIEKGRPTQAAAAAYLAKTYLFKAYRQDGVNNNLTGRNSSGGSYSLQASPAPSRAGKYQEGYEMKAENSVKIQFDSLSANEAFARGAAAAFLARYDPTVPQLADIKTAVSEAVTNCIVHAYPDRIGPVTLCIAVYPERLVKITVMDKGVGIPDIGRAMEPLFTTGNPEERSGLGFAVMQSFMDKVKVSSQPGKGTRVVLTKRLDERST